MPATRTRRRRWMPPEDLRSLDREFVRCRTLGHAWDDFIPMMRPAKFGDRLSLRCLRCAMERHDIISWVDGSLLQRSYDRPEGYTLAERHTRSEFRATLMTIRREDARHSGRAERAERAGRAGRAGVDPDTGEVDVTDRKVSRIRAGAGER